MNVFMERAVGVPAQIIDKLEEHKWEKPNNIAENIYYCTECGAEIQLFKSRPREDLQSWDSVYFYRDRSLISRAESVKGCNENIIRQIIE